MLEKITTILPTPSQNTDLTYTIYYTTQNLLTKKITTHQKHYRQLDDANRALKSLSIGKLV